MDSDLPPAIDPDDPPEGWFWEFQDARPWRSVRQMIQDWWNRWRSPTR